MQSGLEQIKPGWHSAASPWQCTRMQSGLEQIKPGCVFGCIPNAPGCNPDLSKSSPDGIRLHPQCTRMQSGLEQIKPGCVFGCIPNAPGCNPDLSKSSPD